MREREERNHGHYLKDYDSDFLIKIYRTRIRKHLSRLLGLRVRELTVESIRGGCSMLQ
jgi:hypothetical protein